MNKNWKIYISEKEKGFDINEPVAINDCFYANSLEQYDAEIRKPLEEEIERLNKIIAVVQRELPLSQEFEVNGVKFSIEQCMVLKQFNIVHDALIENERKQERQKAITELEEWIKENHKYYICRTHINHLQGKSFSPHMAGASISVYLDTFESDIKQKLNEMKGE